MSKKLNKAPNPADHLFKNLFGGCPPDASFELVAQGVSASRRNAERLLSDTRLLFEAARLSSARFLLTTTREELAKSYILVDTCRLDLKKHESVLRRLCRAFYDHIAKHAYLEVLEFPNINSMSDAKAIWDIEVKRWWPAGPEDGEPEMPHDTYFDREYPLYIDFGDYDRRWLVPTDSDQNAHFMEMFGKTPLSKTEKLIEPWRKADLIGLSSPKVLAILNAIFKKHYVREDATRDQLARLYQQVAERVGQVTGISPESFMASPFVQWPLYHFV
jgi:AbiV family abortive infection protein